MVSLYGEESAASVYQRLEEIDPVLNDMVQRIAYDYFWALPGLSVSEKSFVTIVSLLATEKSEQIQIHLQGFLNTGGAVLTLGHILKILSEKDSSLKDSVHELFDKGRKLVLDTAAPCPEDLAIEVAILSHSARGELHLLEAEIRTYLIRGYDPERLRCFFRHQIAYCGFPTGMNALAVLGSSIQAPLLDSM